MKSSPTYVKRGIFCIVLLTLLVAGSLLWIMEKWGNNANGTDSNKITAEIYQNGVLLYSIDLHAVEEPYTLTITGPNGGENEIAVEKDGIGMLSANCPDKLCVKQGYIHSSLLPITCLPNHLVIQIREESKTGSITDSPADMITY